VKQPRIVLIEPNEALKVRIEAALQGAGFSVITVKNVGEGLKRVYESSADLAIVARELPLMNGEEPVLYFRQACYLPILVLGDDEETTEMLELGADAYMTKPPSLSELVARVRALLRRKPRYTLRSDN